MKNILALAVVLSSSAGFAASTCLVTAENYADGGKGRVKVECNVGSPDSRDVKTADGYWTTKELVTVLNAMRQKGYSIASQIGLEGAPIYTIIK